MSFVVTSLVANRDGLEKVGGQGNLCDEERGDVEVSL